MQVAIDGPSGAGKSTIAKKVAALLNMLYIDSGAMYRAVGLKAARKGVDPKNAEQVDTLLNETTITLKHQPDGQHVYLDGEDVTGKIRTPESSRYASEISAVPACRYKMVDLQREIAAEQDVVMDGRDIGSNVLPQADVKIFLTADIDVRAKRRFDDCQTNNRDQDIEAIKAALAKRDRQDSERAVAPLIQTEDAIRIDSSQMSIDEVVDRVVGIVKNRL